MSRGTRVGVQRMNVRREDTAQAEIDDAVRTAILGGMTIEEFKRSAAACWEAQLRDAADRAHREFFPEKHSG